jgi:hypothetical protein
MWRKTFARYMIHTNPDLLPAISHHLKHLSIVMTELGYCKGDPRKVEMIRDARVQEAGDLIVGLITGERSLEGPVAAEIRNWASEMKIRLGNRSAKSIPDDVRESVRERGIRLYNCGFGWCVFRGDGARCHQMNGESRPLFLRLAPSFANVTPDICRKCKNFGVSPEHKEFWLERLAQNKKKLAEAEADPASKIVHVFQRRVSQCETVLHWIACGGSPLAPRN